MEKGWFIDCHCHLTAEEFRQDINDVIEKSRKAGVQAFVSVTEQQSEFEEVIDLAERYPESVMACFGIHPIQGSADGHRSVTVQDLEPALPFFEKHKDKLVAIGEIGLDFTPWFVSTSQQREEQQKVFALQLDIAKQLDLPVNVHSRSAGRQTIAFLKEQASKVNKTDSTREHLLGDRLTLSWPKERGTVSKERNEPEQIRISCQYIAAVKGLSVETVCEVTTHNALKLFPKVHQRLKE
ncbi:putative deoxyribonuclease tatdn3-A isoform X3 [Mauremys mutica]|uniref:putative deoxyribonuclease tatdn3-A isoform X3 n=1 Tax=Mauremys mutica TaxID=74926 RepID=UPI001D160CE1|nr:putative deoxyribonuclease tatdn3-A isoform X3 [Mauremys mutica]